MKRRVVITGMGAVTPIGNTLDEFWNGIKEEKVGIGAITKFDTEDYKVKICLLYTSPSPQDQKTEGMPSCG